MGPKPINTTKVPHPNSIRSYLVLFALFLLICLGLGYATLNRYRPASIPGLSDSAIYYQLVAGTSPSDLGRPYMRCRILVPLVARPFYHLAQRLVPSIDPIAFGLLVANSIFCAFAACLLVSVAHNLTRDWAVAVLSATLYLLSFAVVNLLLAGLVDAGEACFMVAVIWSLINRKLWWLPLWAILGTLAKETFVPFAIVFAAVWFITERGKFATSNATWLGLLSVASIGTLIALHSVVAGHAVWPWEIAAQAHAEASFLPALLHTISDRGFWYVFVWLLPLGLLGLKRIHRPWVMASAVTGVVVLLLGAWKDMAGTVSRPLFNTVGPMLALSAAMFLTETLNGSRAADQNYD